MDIKLISSVAKKTKGMPAAGIKVHAIGPDVGHAPARVIVTIKAEHMGVPEALASMRLSVQEARDIAEALIREADRAAFLDGPG